MAVWVTMRSGEIRCYNSGSVYRVQNGRLQIASGDPMDAHAIASIDNSMVETVEFTRPSNVTFAPNALDRSLDILLRQARNARGPSLTKLAALKRVLEDFNPQRKTWIR